MVGPGLAVSSSRRGAKTETRRPDGQTSCMHGLWDQQLPTTLSSARPLELYVNYTKRLLPRTRVGNLKIRAQVNLGASAGRSARGSEPSAAQAPARVAAHADWEPASSKASNAIPVIHRRLWGGSGLLLAVVVFVLMSN